jgi:hypothetical protein
MKFLSFLLGLLLMAGTAIADSPLGTIEGRLQFPDKTAFNITTKVTLNHGERSTYSRADGSFSVYNVEPGIHVLDVQSVTHHFSQIKIQLLEEDMGSPKCLEYFYPGATKQPAAYPLALNAIATYDYFEKRQGFSIFSMLKNPMVLMMGFSAVLMFIMPKMMEGLEPEDKERMKQQMEMQKDPTKMFGQLWGDLTGPGEDEKSKPRKIKK